MSSIGLSNSIFSTQSTFSQDFDEVQEILFNVPPEKIELLHKLPRTRILEALLKLKSTLKNHPYIFQNENENSRFYCKALLLQIIDKMSQDSKIELIEKFFVILDVVGKKIGSIIHALELLTSLLPAKNFFSIIQDVDAELILNPPSSGVQVRWLISDLELITTLPKEAQEIILAVHLDNKEKSIMYLTNLGDLIVVALQKLQTSLAKHPNIFRNENEASQAYCKVLLIQIFNKISQTSSAEATAIEQLFALMIIEANNNEPLHKMLETLAKWPFDIHDIIDYTMALSREGTNFIHEIIDMRLEAILNLTFIPVELQEDTCYVEVNLKDLEENPRNVLRSLCNELEPLHTILSVDFDDEGSDQGGLGRQLISEIFTGIKKFYIATDRNTYAHSIHFTELNNGLFRPELFLDKLGKYKSLSEEDKITLQDIGKLMMFCFHPEDYNNYPIGTLFDLGVFTGLVKLKEHHLSENLEIFNPDKSILFDELLDIYTAMIMYNEDEQNYFSQVKQYLQPLRTHTDRKTLEAAFSLVFLEDNIVNLEINGEIDKIRAHYPQIQDTIKKVVFHEKIRPALTPIIEIAKGMKDAHFGYGWEVIREEDPVILSEYIQGTVTAQYILDSLEFSENIPNEIEKGLKKWIKKADVDKRQQFLFAVTGSPALAGKKIEIRGSSDQLHFHTCSNQIDINYTEILATKNPKATLWEGIEIAIALINKDKKFDTA